MPNETVTFHHLQAREFLRRHAMAAAAQFAAQAQVEIEDEAIALIAEFMIAITLTDAHYANSIRRAPHAVMAAARLLFSRDELKKARAEHREECRLGSVSDEREAREKAEENVARFFAAVDTGANLWDRDPVLKLINSIGLSKTNAAKMALLIDTWQKRQRCERRVAKDLPVFNPADCSKIHD